MNYCISTFEMRMKSIKIKYESTIMVINVALPWLLVFIFTLGGQDQDVGADMRQSLLEQSSLTT